MTLKDLYQQANSFASTDKLPLLFLGHGSPMNAIEDNEFSQQWQQLGNSLQKPRAIVCISAHWETKGTFVTTNSHPETIHDFYGFPKELFAQQYPAAGSPELAKKIIHQIQDKHIEGTDKWGLDHGTWSVMKHIYPKADIPVVQISIDHFKDTAWHFELGRALSFLRSKGVLVVGSGNMIHNLRMIQVPENGFNAEYAYDWAFELNDIMKQKINNNELQSLVDYRSLHKDATLAIPTPEHYIPMLYILGMKQEEERVQFFNDKVIAGSLNMTSFVVG